ncbi:MAG: rhodanese-like domain-containing protein [Ornithinimicrobium sp.]
MSDSTDMPTISVNDLADDERMLDVRTHEEWAAGHAPNARNSPLRSLGTSLGNIDINERIAVVCRSGGRSSQAVEYLRKEGFDAVNVEGGMQAWAEANKEMVSEGDDDPTVASSPSH